MVFLWALSFNQLSLHAAFDLLSTQSKGRRVIKRDDFFSQMSPLLQHHMTSADVAILFKLLDRDNDGEISRIEFFASLHMAKDLNATNQTRRHGYVSVEATPRDIAIEEFESRDVDNLSNIASAGSGITLGRPGTPPPRDIATPSLAVSDMPSPPHLNFTLS
mmetsp:Transcript_68920/g.162184  ORF Transcript_68920/g.162184 Transcript_68920/m.162184 type:complete len:162 (+) Transcript_68920:80-565(+)